jgi:hypothetical protein
MDSNDLICALRLYMHWICPFKKIPCLFPTKRSRPAAPPCLAVPRPPESGPRARGDRASTSRAPPPAGEDRRRPMAVAPAAHAYRASASVTTRTLRSTSA